MKHISVVKDVEALRVVVMQELQSFKINTCFRKSRHDFKPGRFRFMKPNQSSNTNFQVIGVDLDRLNPVPVVLPEDKVVVKIPFFFTMLIDYLRQYMNVEGILRKEGVLKRESEILKNIMNGNFDVETSNVFDICCIVKRFLRNIPGGIIPLRFHDMLLECACLDEESMRRCILSVCLLFPRPNLDLIIYLMRFLKEVSEQSSQNGMSINNLAIVLAPSLLNSTNRKMESLAREREIIAVLVNCADEIGYITDSMYNNAALQSASMSNQKNETQPASLLFPERKRRSSSLKGVLSSLHNSFTKLRRRSSSSANGGDRFPSGHVPLKHHKLKDSLSSTDFRQKDNVFYLSSNRCRPEFVKWDNSESSTSSSRNSLQKLRSGSSSSDFAINGRLQSGCHSQRKVSEYESNLFADFSLSDRGVKINAYKKNKKLEKKFTVNETKNDDVRHSKLIASMPAVSTWELPESKPVRKDKQVTKETSMNLLTRGANTTIDEMLPSEMEKISSNVFSDEESSVGILDTARIECDEEDDEAECINISEEKESSSNRSSMIFGNDRNKRAIRLKRLNSLLSKKATTKQRDVCQLLNQKDRLDVIRRMINENMVTPVSFKSSLTLGRLTKNFGAPMKASDFVGQLDSCKKLLCRKRTSSFISKIRCRDTFLRKGQCPSRVSITGSGTNSMSIAKNNFGENV